MCTATLPQFAREITLVREGAAAAVFTRDLIGLPMQQLHTQQLFEGKPRTPAHGLGHAGGAMHHAQRVRQRRHIGRVDEPGGKRLLHQRQQRIEVLLHHGAQQTHGQPFGAGIHGEHPSFSGAFLLRPEVDELARLQPAAVKEAHRAGAQQPIVLVDGAIEKRLPGQAISSMPLASWMTA